MSIERRNPRHIDVCRISGLLLTGIAWICIPFTVTFAVVLVHALLQVARIVPVNSDSGYCALAGFDNPAGLSAALTVSFPFVLALVDGIGSKRMKYCIVMLVSVAVLPMLADNVTHPLNEFVLVAVNFGLAGVAVLMATITITVRHYIRRPDRESSVGMMVLAGTAVMAMFSYPFRYPLTVLATVFSLLLVFKDILQNMGRRLKVVSMSAAVATSVIGLFFTVSWTDLQIRWGRLSAEWESGGSSARILEGYSELYPRLKKDPYFLYNYAYVLSENGDCGSAARMAAESFDLMPDYDTALFLADNARECGMPDSAEYYYRLASRMCPVRFLPLYGLFQLFEESGRIEEMQEMGKFILAKPVKVNSNVIRQIRSEVRQILISS